LDDLVAATAKGILIAGRGSYSIDQQRYNFQFGGQVFIEVRDGKLVGMLKDVAYQGRTPEFWNSMDMLGGAESYELGGTFGDAKGQLDPLKEINAAARRIELCITTIDEESRKFTGTPWEDKLPQILKERAILRANGINITSLEQATELPDNSDSDLEES